MANDTNIYHFEFDKEFWARAEKIVLRMIVIALAIQSDTLNTLIDTV
tara:strand:- start:105 stop:245 length:141 start_codon:yes stop_codon:yes gene_type:complete